LGSTRSVRFTLSPDLSSIDGTLTYFPKQKRLRSWRRSLRRWKLG
jgi:hypothetical protein